MVQGYQTCRENSDASTAIKEREEALTQWFQRATSLPAARLSYEGSHSTTVDSLSRISILTFREPAVAGQVLRSIGSRRCDFHGGQIFIRRQTAAFDRICSAPAKIAMSAVSKQNPTLEKQFEPKWRDGIVMNPGHDPHSPIIRWTIDVESARIRLWIAPTYHDVVQKAMVPGLRRLQFGPMADQEENNDDHGRSTSAAFTEKGKSKKGGGKGSKAKRSMPIDQSAFRHEHGLIKDALGNLHFAKFPFSVHIKKAEGDERGEKRTGAEPVEQQPKKRSPTPTRQT